MCENWRIPSLKTLWSKDINATSKHMQFVKLKKIKKKLEFSLYVSGIKISLIS